MIKKSVILILVLLLCLSTVIAIDYTTKFNPFTGKLDYVWDGVLGTVNLNGTSLFGEVTGLINSTIVGDDTHLHKAANVTDFSAAADLRIGLNPNNFVNSTHNYNTTQFEQQTGAGNFLGIIYSWFANTVSLFTNNTINRSAVLYGDVTGNLNGTVITDNSHSLNANNITAGTFGTGNFTFAGNVSLNNQTLTRANTILGSDSFIRIGDVTQTSGHTLTANDDLLATGKLEVDGVIYGDGGAEFTSNVKWFDGNEINMGTGDDVQILYSAVQTPDNLFTGVGQDGRALVIAEAADKAFDFAHALQTNPTLFIHSANQNTAQWIGLTHNGRNGVISTGTGNISVNSQNVTDVECIVFKSGGKMCSGT
mgnify:FL=1